MKPKILMVGMMVVLFWTAGVYAMMGEGSGPGMGGGQMGGGMGSGMAGDGGMMSTMMRNTMFYGYLDVLHPIGTPDEARAAVQSFINASNSSLVISALWEYGTVYKAELSDTAGAKAFDLIADKFTGAVMPEMGLSMMLNASYGKGLYKMPAFGKNLSITPEQARVNVQGFLAKNSFGYILGSPETYPGYYKFHTSLEGKHGMEIMVDGYRGQIWMTTLYGSPTAQH